MPALRSSRRPTRFLSIAWLLITVVLAAAPAPPVDPVAYQLNDRVETNLSGSWLKGTVVEIGKGDREGQLRVHSDGYPNHYVGWVRLHMKGVIRKLAGAAPHVPVDDGSAKGPRAGKYLIYAYGAPSAPRIFLGHVEMLAGGKYRVSRTTKGDYFGEGTYSFDPALKRVQWLSGPYKEEAGWGGAFEVDREGKTHTIRLRRGTIATNSTD